MKVDICAELGLFRRKLAENTQVIVLVTGRSAMSAVEVVELDALLQQPRVRQVEEIADIREATERLIIEFFRAAAAVDLDFHWAYSAGVPLSIPGYRDIQQIFSLYVISDVQHDEIPVIALIPDMRLRMLAESILRDERRAGAVCLPGYRSWLRVLRSTLRWLFNQSPAVKRQPILFSLRHDNGRVERDAYFGALPKLLDGKVVNVVLASGSRVRFPRYRYVPLESFLKPSDLLLALVATIRDGIERWAIGSRSNAMFDLIGGHMRSLEQRSGENFTGHLIERAAYRLATQQQPPSIMFPFENRSWERRFVRGLRRGGVGMIIGYQHSSVTRRHLAFRLGNGGDIKIEMLPDRIITVGDVTCRWISRESPVLAGRLCVGGSLRRIVENLPEPTEKAVLIAISSSRDEAINIFQYVQAACVVSDFKFIIRSHPVIPIEDIFRCFEWSENVDLSCGRSLKDDLARVSCVAYSSSTVAIEGMLYGRLPIYLDAGDIPDGDPVMEKAEFGFAVTRPGEFAGQLNQMGAMSEEELCKRRRLAMEYAQSYLGIMDDAALAVFRSCLGIDEPLVQG